MADSLRFQVKQLVETSVYNALSHYFQKAPFGFEWTVGDVISLITGYRVRLRIVLLWEVVYVNVQEIEDGALEITQQ